MVPPPSKTVPQDVYHAFKHISLWGGSRSHLSAAVCLKEQPNIEDMAYSLVLETKQGELYYTADLDQTDTDHPTDTAIRFRDSLRTHVDLDLWMFVLPFKFIAWELHIWVCVLIKFTLFPHLEYLSFLIHIFFLLISCSLVFTHWNSLTISIQYVCIHLSLNCEQPIRDTWNWLSFLRNHKWPMTEVAYDIPSHSHPT